MKTQDFFFFERMKTEELNLVFKVSAILKIMLAI